jgi:predicted negative regulator of RcsB-dependent stress response
VDQYRTEEEQVEALRRWWDENGRSTIAAIVVAVAVGFGWQAYKSNDQQKRENASDLYQSMLQGIGQTGASAEQQEAVIDIAEQIKDDYSGSTYAQFAALHLASRAVGNNELAEAEAQLRWVLGKAAKGSDTAEVAQLRLARVLAAAGDADQALAILAQAGEGPYQASYAVARGDILLMQGRDDEAREAYANARILAGDAQGQVNLPSLEHKMQSLMPVPARSIDMAGQAAPAVEDALAIENDAATSAEDTPED